MYGPGVEKGVKTNQPTYFTVDCTGAGNGMFNFMPLLCLKTGFWWF